MAQACRVHMQADATHLDAFGRSALDIAESNGHTAFVEARARAKAARPCRAAPGPPPNHPLLGVAIAQDPSRLAEG